MISLVSRRFISQPPGFLSGRPRETPIDASPQQIQPPSGTQFLSEPVSSFFQQRGIDSSSSSIRSSLQDHIMESPPVGNTEFDDEDITHNDPHPINPPYSTMIFQGAAICLFGFSFGSLWSFFDNFVEKTEENRYTVAQRNNLPYQKESTWSSLVSYIYGLGRYGKLYFTAARIALDYKTLNSDDQKVWDECHTRSAKKIAKIISENGGLFIKLGQHICAMSYLVPPQWAEEMKPFLDDAPFQSFQKINKVFQQEFGGFSLHDVFCTIQTMPMASASLAQVHKATLLVDMDSGQLVPGYEARNLLHKASVPGAKFFQIREQITRNQDTEPTIVTRKYQLIDVAVKLQYPGLKENCVADVQVYELLADLGAHFFPEFDFRWFVREYKVNVPKELDFLLEAQNANTTRHLLADLHNVTTPSIILPLSSHRILTMEYIDGVKISDIETLNKWQLSRNRLMQVISKTFAKMVFLDGFIHCDPHSSNIFVRIGSSISNLYESIKVDHLLDGTPALGEISLVTYQHALNDQDAFSLVKKPSLVAQNPPTDSGVNKLNTAIKFYTESIGMNHSAQIELKTFSHPDDFLQKNRIIESDDFQVILLDHGLYSHLDDKVRINYSLLWKNLLFANERNIQFYSNVLGADEMYELFASILTARSWDNVGGSLFHLSNQPSEKDKKVIQAALDGLLKDITDICANIPPSLILVLKMNDNLREIQEHLSVSMSSWFIEQASMISQALYIDNVKMLQTGNLNQQRPPHELSVQESIRSHKSVEYISYSLNDYRDDSWDDIFDLVQQWICRQIFSVSDSLFPKFTGFQLLQHRYFLTQQSYWLDFRISLISLFFYFSQSRLYQYVEPFLSFLLIDDQNRSNKIVQQGQAHQSAQDYVQQVHQIALERRNQVNKAVPMA